MSILRDTRLLNRIVDIYPDGLVIGNGPGGVYLSQNFGKTWNLVMGPGPYPVSWYGASRIDNVKRLSDTTFVYDLKGVTGATNIQRMVTYDTFQSNIYTNEAFWDGVVISNSVCDSDICYVAKVETYQDETRCVVRVVERKTLHANANIPEKKYLGRYYLNVDSIRCFNVLKKIDKIKGDSDILVATSNGGKTVRFEIGTGRTSEVITGDRYVTTDGVNLITNLEENRTIRNSLSYSHIPEGATEPVVVKDFFPNPNEIRHVSRVDKTLYIFYNDDRFTVIRYDIVDDCASLFFQLRNKTDDFTIDTVRPSLPVNSGNQIVQIVSE